MKPLSDHILVQRIKLGDRRAADSLVDRHYQRVYVILYSFCKNRETAEDLTQDTFVKMWNSIHRFDELTSLAALKRNKSECLIVEISKHKFFLNGQSGFRLGI